MVYPGGLGASRHLLTPMENIWFRAGIVIGPGRAGFEIIRNLVQKLPPNPCHEPIMADRLMILIFNQTLDLNDCLNYKCV